MDEGGCLENNCGGNLTGGSNPSPSAIVIKWGGAGVDERGRLLSGCRGLAPTEGSNPSLPAIN